jgi:hypothetical protein
LNVHESEDNIVKMAIFSTFIYSFRAVPFRIAADQGADSKIHMER